jgi:hypothetical protein
MRTTSSFTTRIGDHAPGAGFREKRFLEGKVAECLRLSKPAELRNGPAIWLRLSTRRDGRHLRRGKHRAPDPLEA